jgi:hypothetical protein
MTTLQEPATIRRGPRVLPREVGIAAPMMLDNVDTDVISPLGKPPTPGMTMETAAFEPLRVYSDGREKPDFSGSTLFSTKNFNPM